MGILNLISSRDKKKIDENKRMMKLYESLKNQNDILLSQKAELEERKLIIAENRRIQDENTCLEEEIRRLKEEIRELIRPTIKFTIKDE